MGFLGFGNYAKPGRGVSKDEPKKKSFFLFFELYFRKFWKLIEVNMLYFVLCIPFFIPFILVNTYFPNPVLYYISMIPFIGIAVVTSGFTYVLRNFAREMPVFIWADFIDTMKKNWKQSLIIGTIDFVAFFIISFSLNFYYQQISTNNIFSIPFVLSILFTVIFVFMQYYIFPMLITFYLNIRQILKNAFIFVFAGLGYNIVITFFCGLLALVVYLFSPLTLFLIPFLILSTFGFIIVFNSWHVIDKYMMPKDEDSDNEDDEDIIFKDRGRER
jgi:Protein of unknown function, DUF624.